MGATVYLNSGAMQPEDGMRLIDTHCHLDLEPLFAHLPRVLATARQCGVSDLVVPGVHPDGWERIRALVNSQAGVHAAFGLHPMHAGLADDQLLATLESIAPAGIAIGEIGLDPGYSVPMASQEHAFRQQVRLALRLGLPVLVHCRKSFQQTATILREEAVWRVGGIMHAFSGSVEMAREFIRLGLAISLSGVVTWDNVQRPLRLARELPLEQLVLETDAPDMTPRRYRGRWNRPAWMVETVAAVAAVRGMAPAELARACTATTLRVLPGLRTG